MAKKGQKFQKHSNEIRSEIIEKYMSRHYSYVSLANEYGISWKTIESFIRKYKQTGLTIKSKRGRQKEKELTKEDYKERYEIIKKY